MKETKRELGLFLILTFIITYGLGIIALIKGGLEQFPVARYSMYIPAIVVLILYLFVFKKPVFKNNDIGLKFKGWKYWFIAPITIFGITSLTFLISYIISPELILDKEKIISSANDFLDVNNWTLSLTIIFLLNVLIAPLLNIFMFLGEEIGWRSFMTPRLLKLFNPFTAFLIAGFVWGIWHAFGIIMGLNYPGNPIIGNIMMILLMIPIGIIFQYFYFISKSIFVPALAHGALNWTATTYLMFVFNSDKVDTLIYGPTGIVGLIIWWIFGIWFFTKFKTAYNTQYSKKR
ncbi:MAG: type II CAAX endopeptidase family protein [Candidatus Cloacimonadota bacterium]|nr:type II CAAX endopeptidase family protein [Candidatus Cloacimonadota bacterium]